MEKGCDTDFNDTELEVVRGAKNLTIHLAPVYACWALRYLPYAVLMSK